MGRREEKTYLGKNPRMGFPDSRKPERNERSPLFFGLAQKLRQLGKDSGDPLRLVAREQFTTPKSAKGLLFEIHVGEGLPVGVLHHEAAIKLLD
jgi:hypothetical protein